MSHSAPSSKEITLAILPKISSTLSICGSTLILVECFYFDRQRLQRVYNRLLCTMAFFDIMESVWNWASTFPIPAQTEGVAFAVGNDAICTAQGFFLQFGLAIPILNAFLSLYYLLVVRYSWSEEKIRVKAEPWFYVISIGIGFGTALASVPLQLYHSSGLWCWIAPAVAAASANAASSNSTDSISSSSDISEEEVDASDASASRDFDNHYQLYRYVFYFIPLFVCFTILTMNMGLLTWTVRKLETASKRYRSKSFVKKCRRSSSIQLKQPPPSQIGSCRENEMDRRSSFVGRFSLRSSLFRNGFVAIPASVEDANADAIATDTSSLNVESGPQKHCFKSVNSNGRGKVQRSDHDKDIRQILALKRSARAAECTTKPSFPLVMPTNNDTDAGNEDSLSLCNNLSGSTMAFKILDVEGEENEYPDLASTSNIPSNSNGNGNKVDLRSSFLRSYRNSVKELLVSAPSTLDKKKSSKKSKSKQVTEQALFYVLSFVLTFIWSFLNRFFVLSGKDTPFVILLGNAFFDPLQGFINYLVYMRPKLISYRKKYPFSTFYQRVKAIVTHNEIPHDEDKEVEDCAKEELLKWRNMRLEL